MFSTIYLINVFKNIFVLQHIITKIGKQMPSTRNSLIVTKAFLGIATPVAVPIFEIKIVRLLARFFTHFGHPRQADTISDDLRCPPINRRRPSNNLRLVARFCVVLQIQVEIQCLRLNWRRPPTTLSLSVIVSDESYNGIVVNRPCI